jgi:hypothetical protein
MAKKKCKQKNPGQVIIPTDHPNPPEQHEVDAAYVLARHYQTTVEFLVPVDDYKRKSADILMQGVQWEIKCPTGESKSTIRNQFRRASRQSKCIIIDLRRTKIKYGSIEKEVHFQVRERPYIQKLILIDKFEKVIEIQT